MQYPGTCLQTLGAGVQRRHGIRTDSGHLYEVGSRHNELSIVLDTAPGRSIHCAQISFCWPFGGVTKP